MTSETSLPAKEGFREPYKFERPPPIIIVLLVILALASTILVFDHIRPVLEYGYPVLVAALIGTLLINVQIHERVHALLHRLLGYEPEIKIAWHKTSGYCHTPGQFVHANHNVVNLLSPLIVLDFFYSIFLIGGDHRVISLIAALLFLDNTVASVGDIYGAYFDYGLPEGSLVYFPEGGGSKVSYIYEPGT